METIRIIDISAQSAIKHVRIVLAPGNDQEVLLGVAGKAWQVTGVEISNDIAGQVRVHFGAFASIATKAIAGGYFGAAGGRVYSFGAYGPQGAVAEAINASVVTTTNAEIIVHYLERAS